MPIYEYKCLKCNNITEMKQKFSDPILTECQHCKGELKRMISKSGFILKGYGWYGKDKGDCNVG